MGFPKGFKNTEIAVLEHLELKIFFATQPWWTAFKQAIIDLKKHLDLHFSLISIPAVFKNIEFHQVNLLCCKYSTMGWCIKLF